MKQTSRDSNEKKFLLLFVYAGSHRNIYFPFDILNDTPIDVATEMVKELEIIDWEPFEIANMIEGEISALVPNWRTEAYHTFNYQEDDDGPHYPFHSFSSCSSSQSSFSGLMSSHGINVMTNGCDQLQGMPHRILS